MSKLRLASKVLAGLALVAACGLAFVWWYDSTGQRADPQFDATVLHPAYAGTGAPRVAFDVAHRNWHTPAGRYRPFADLLKHDGYDVAEFSTAFSATALGTVKVLIVANAMGPGGHEGHPAFEESEEVALVDWVRQGGALLLIADHVPFGAAAERLAKRFGVEMFLAFARDDDHHFGWDNERLLFSRSNGLLVSSPITDGRTPDERIDTVVTFTGQSLSVPEGATPLLRMADGAYDWESRSVRHSARGHAQAVAMTFGRGRLIVLGEAGLLSAQIDPLGNRMGMNMAGNDDRQFALNLLHWLSGALPDAAVVDRH